MIKRILKRGSVSKIFILALSVVFGVGSFLEKAFADESGGDSVSVRIFNPLACDNITCVGQKIIEGLSILAVPLVAIMALWGGFQILTAGGNPEKFATGKKTLLYAVIGFAVVIVAQGVVFIIRSLFEA